MKYLILKHTYFFFLLAIPLLHAQQVKVIDDVTGEAIPNVAIYNTDKSTIALTDFDGVFSAAMFTAERITAKHMGYEVVRTSKTTLRKQGYILRLFPKLEQLDEVVMSVSKWEQQKKDIPNKIVSIDAKTIAFTNPQTAADLLQQSGKVFVQKSQLGGGSPMIRGFSTNRLVLSVDGVRMNNAIFRGGNLQNVISIDPFTIKNTEVIFGPGSVVYGSDAIGGVMNFYTKVPELSDTANTSVYGGGNYRFATANLENTIHANVGVGKNKWASLTSITYNSFQDLVMGKHGPDSYLRDNYVTTTNGVDALRKNENPRKQVATGYDQINLMQKLRYKPNSEWDVRSGIFYSETSDYARYDRGIRPSRDGAGLRSAEWNYGPQKWFMGNVQVNRRGNGKFYDGLKITSAYQHFEESRINRDFDSPVRSLTKENVDALNFNVDFENKKIGNFRLYYGGEYIYNKVHSQGQELRLDSGEVLAAPSRYPDNATWQSFAGYTHGEFRAKPNFTVLSGLRYTHVLVNAAFDNQFYDFPFQNADLSTGALTGSLGISWFPKSDLQLTANGSTGFRAPNIDDIGKVFDSEPGAVVVPNPDVVPEYAYNVELGVQKNFGDILVVKGATYYTYLVDALVRRDFSFNGADEIVYQGALSRVQAIQNVAMAYVYGFEFGLDAFLSERWTLSSNLTITEGVEEEENGTITAARHAAPTFGDVHLIWKNQRLKTDFFLNYNGEVPFVDLALSERAKDYIYATDDLGNPFSPSWYTLNFRSQYAISTSITATMHLENITNQRYRPYSSGIAAPGSNLILGVAYDF